MAEREISPKDILEITKMYAAKLAQWKSINITDNRMSKEKETRQNFEPPQSKEQALERNCLLLFKTNYGGLLGWNIKSKLTADEISNHIEAAAKEWLLSPEGKDYIDKEEIADWGMDNANALMDVPFEILAKHGIEMKNEVYEIVELDSNDNLLPEELRG